MDEVSSDTTKAVPEPPHIHIDIHVHLDGAIVSHSAGRREFVDAESKCRSVSATPSRRSLLMTLLIGFGVSAVGYLGFRAGGVSSQPKASGVNQAAVWQEPSAGAPTPLPDALARDLQRPPQITPAPGTPVAAGQSGPAAFGLQQ